MFAKPTDAVHEVLKRYSDRFQQAAESDTSGLTIVEVGGVRELMPTRTHAVWLLMWRAQTAEEAERLATEHLNRGTAPPTEQPR